MTPQDPTSVGPDHIDWWRNPTTGQPTTNAIDWHATHTNDGQPHNPGCYICITNDSDHMARDPRPTTLPKDRPTTIDDVLRLRQPPPNAAGTCTADCKAEHDDGWTCIHGRSKSTARYDTATTATTPTDTVITAEHLTLHTAHITAGHPTNSACTVCQQMDTPPAAVTDATDDGLPVAAVPIEELAEFQPSERAQAIRARLEAQRAAGHLPTNTPPAPAVEPSPQPVGDPVDDSAEAHQDDAPSSVWQRGTRVRLRHTDMEGTVVDRQLRTVRVGQGRQVQDVGAVLVEWRFVQWHTPGELEVSR